MIRRFFIALIAIIGIFVIVVAFQPSDFRISRTATINAPASAVFPKVNDFHNWEDWSPWAKIDPEAVSSYGGTREGVGAIFHWKGNEQVGEGTMTITDSRPSELIVIKLDFREPFEATNTAEFTFQEANNQTMVSWSMFGKNNFIGKAMSLVMDCDKMVGEQFEKGLSQMKSVVEGTPR